MPPDAFLANAQRMLRDANGQLDECATRAVVHATYYAVYHLVANGLGLDPAVKGQAPHADVSNKVAAYAGTDAAIIAAKGEYESLRVARVQADYKLGPQMGQRQAMLAISRALRVFKAAGVTPKTI